MAESNLNNSYEAEMQRRGLGALFQAEGPERSGRLVTIPGAGMFTGGASLPGPYSYSDRESVIPPKSRAQVLKELKDAGISKEAYDLYRGQDGVRDPFKEGLGFMPETPNTLEGLQAELKAIRESTAPVSIQESRKKIVDRIEGMPDDSDVFAASPLDMMAAPMPEFSVTAEGKKVTGQTSGAADESTAQNLITDKLSQTTTGPSPEEVAMMEAARSEGQGAPAENAFMEALAAKNDAEGKEQPKAKTRAELLEKYKQEFAEATGINIDGKPDNSQALMAMGLSLMQNRAGKKFNVGKILNAFGEAGEKAMPALSAARKEAKAARVAAGKYALGQIKADEDAALAIETASRALQKELYLKDVEFANDKRLKILEAELEGGNKLTEALKNTEQQTLRIGAQEIKLGRGQDIEFNARTVWSDPLLDSKEIASAYRKTAEGLGTLQQMEGLLLDMKDLGDTSVGGTAGAKTLSKIIEVGNSMGMGLSYPSGQDVSIPSQIEVLQRSVLARFKKFLTQETGNGISNVDVADIKAALGQFETFGDIDKAIMSVKTMQELFMESQITLDPIVDTFLDRRQYRGNKEGEYQYSEVLKMFDKSFGDVNYIDFTEAVGADGVKIKDYDIRG